MRNIQDLVPTLAKLPRDEYAKLIKQVDAERRQFAEQEAEQHPPGTKMSKDEFAVWIARQHYAVDKGIDQILYLPTGAPEREVRLLEVNSLASLPEDRAVGAVDFMPDIDGLDYSLFVGDVTPGQCEAIRKGQLGLPEGWELTDAREIPVTDQ